MRKDVKAGMIIGVGIVAVMTITISLQPGQNIQSRHQRVFEESEPTPAVTVKHIALPKPPSEAPPALSTTQPAESITVIDTTPNLHVPIYHIVQSGETLYSIADHYYDDPAKWKNIKNANKNIHEQNTLRPDMRLLIPILDRPDYCPDR